MRTETDGFRLNQRWFHFRRRPRDQSTVGNPTVSDGRHSPSTDSSQNGIPTFEQILEVQHLDEASRLLIEREQHLFGELKEEEALIHHDEEVKKLAADHKALKGLVLQTLRLSLSLEELRLEALKSAVKAVKQMEDQDQLWSQRDRTPPSWRPSRWKALHDSTLRHLVEDRLDNPLTPPADQGDQSSIQADVLSMGRQLKDDLLFVVSTVKSCYPQEMDICNFYARLYHQTLSARLKKIADFGLVDRDCTYLLLWVNEFYPTQILQKPELASEIDVEALGKLLPKELLEPLEKQYLSKQQSELSTYIGRVLGEAKQKWTRGEKPTIEDGCFVSPVAINIIQLINGMVTTAEHVLGDLQKAQTITSQLNDFMQRFKNFQNDVIKQNKPNSRPIIKAHLCCIEQFSDVLEKRSYLFSEDVHKNCVTVLTDMKRSAHMYLLKPVHEVLKPQYRKLGTSDWLKKPVFENLLDSMDKELRVLQGSTESCHRKLIGQLHQEVTAEYVKRLMKGHVKLKDNERQLKAYVTVKDNAENLHHFFIKMGSEEDWLMEILIKIAEVLKLQDIPAIQMQVVSLGTAYPDLSVTHVSALLKLKTNLSKADRRAVTETLMDVLKEIGSTDSTHPFFTRVLLKGAAKIEK